jgi:hypothetical protein
MVGSVFCENCGIRLAPEIKSYQNPKILQESPKSTLLNRSSNKKNEAWVFLYSLENGEMFPLPNKDEITIGRYSIEQPTIPDVDLTRFNAFENGVSRLHCVLKKIKKMTYVSDLGSSNGSTLNGIQLPENRNIAFKHGDVLVLGKLKFQLLLLQN